MPAPAGSSSPRFAAVVVAAGLSSRMGKPKVLLDFAGQPLVCHVVDRVRKVGSIDPIVVVTGHAAEQVSAALDGVRIVHNGRFARGEMLSSVQTGAAAVRGKCDAFFIVLGDQPMIRPSTFAAMAQAWGEQPAAVVAPMHQGKRGHPILLSTRLIDELLLLPNDATLKTLVTTHSHQTTVLPVDDPAVLCDIDTLGDYQQALRNWRNLSCPSQASPEGPAAEGS